MKLRQLFEQSSLSDNPSQVRTQWNGFLRRMKFEVFKLKGLSEQVINDYIRGAEERLEACMVKEAEEKAQQEAEEKARLEAEEQNIKEAEEKATAEDAAVEAKAQANIEEAARIAAEEAAKSIEFSLTRGESSTFDIAPLVLQTLEKLQKEQQLVIARLDKQDSVNSSIQNLLTSHFRGCLLLQTLKHPRLSILIFALSVFASKASFSVILILSNEIFFCSTCFSLLCSF